MIQKNDDMNKNTLTKMIFGAALLLLLAACSQDELADSNGTSLPEGKYPLQIASVSLSAEVTDEPWGASHAPQTRVAENTGGNSSHWESGDEITVQLGDKTTTYNVNIDCSLTLTGEQLYWTKRTDDVTAWFPGNGTIYLSQQTTKLAYVLKAVAESASCDQTINLDFEHQLSKIRVVLTGEKAENVKGVSIESYTSCTNTNGTVSTDKASIGEIAMYQVDNNTYEANVVPGQEITKFKVNSGEWVNLSKSVMPEKGRWHKIKIDVEPAGPTPITPGETITEGEYIMTGTFTEGVTLNGDNINLIIEEASNTATTAIHVKGGTPTITVKGTNNSFNCGNTPILLDPNANVVIKGSTSNPADSKLTIRTSTDNAAGIGSASTSSCGNISIADITLDVHGGTGKYGGAAIGTNGSFGSSCGNITIENSVVYAKGGTGAAAIGLACGSDPRSCGEIVIRHSKIYATTTYDDFYIGYAACIGHGAFAYNQPVTVGKITITTDESKEVFFGTDRFKAIDDSGKEVTTGFYKVGKCNISKYQSSQTWSGVYFGKEGEETELTSGSSNGYQ